MNKAAECGLVKVADRKKAEEELTDFEYLRPLKLEFRGQNLADVLEKKNFKDWQDVIKFVEEWQNKVNKNKEDAIKFVEGQIKVNKNKEEEK